MNPPRPIDWQTILDELAWLLGEDTPTGRQRAGTRVLAAYLHVNRGAVRRWLEDGSEPRHSDGELLLAAWCRLTGRHPDFAPRTRPVLSAAKV
jgi:hypothetical protein